MTVLVPRPWLLVISGMLAGCSTQYRVGDRILVEWEGHEYPASVLVIESPNRLRIHYEGYETNLDEIVALTRVKGKVHGPVVHPPPPAKFRARMAPSPSASTSSLPSLYKPNERVKVQWKESWYTATILQSLPNETYRVHYEGYDSNWEETVEASRIQRK